MTTLLNGVNVDKLGKLIESVRHDPALGRLEFRVSSQWKGGFRTQHTTAAYTFGTATSEHLRNHSFESDEPERILGTDAGISPSEIILSALSACLAVGWAANAAAMGIELESLRLEVTGEGDIQGFMNLNDVRAGLSNISVRAHVHSSAPKEKLEALHEYVISHSPMWDTIASPVDVRSELVIP